MVYLAAMKCICITGTLCVLDNETTMPSVQCCDTERQEELCQQLKQANDTAARLQDELRQTKDRERELQMQLDKMTFAITKLQSERKEFELTKQSDRKSNRPIILVFIHRIFLFITVGI